MSDWKQELVAGVKLHLNERFYLRKTSTLQVQPYYYKAYTTYHKLMLASVVSIKCCGIDFPPKRSSSATRKDWVWLGVHRALLYVQEVNKYYSGGDWGGIYQYCCVHL